MGWSPNPIGIVSALAALFAFAMAAFVYFARPGLAANRRLAVLLVFEGTWVLGGSGIIYLTDRENLAFASQGLADTTLLLLPALTLLFLATLDTPLVRPLRTRAAQAVIVGLSLAAEVWWFTHPERFIAGMRPEPGYAAWEADFGDDHLVAIWGLGFVSLFGLAAAVDAYARTLPGTPTRRKQGAFVLAFGVLELGIAFFTLVVRQLTPLGGGDRLQSEYYLVGTALVILAHIPLLAYGILRTQLFDIDLQLKRVFRWTAVPGAIVFVFMFVGFVAHELAGVESLPLSSGVAAAVALPLLVFAVPLSRVAEKLSAFALPGVEDTPDYQAARRLEMYRSALEEALAKGVPTDKEATFLEDTRRRLGITREEHRVLLLMARSTPRAPRRGPSKDERFRLLRELGHGGSGRALLAHDSLLDRKVVLKQPLAPWLLDEGGREEFMREARLLAKVHHPNVVALHEVLTEGELPVLVLEFVEGGSLEDKLRTRRLAPEETARLGLDVLAGLERIHRDGIVHRDVKPANILLAQDGEAKLTDFGIAFPPGEQGRGSTKRATMRQPGSLAYMSPEQASSRQLDERTDLYSLGVVLYESLAGRHYLDLTGRPESEVRRMIAEAPPRLPDARVPTGFERVLERALAKTPGKRFATASAMAEALEKAVAVRVAVRRTTKRRR